RVMALSDRLPPPMNRPPPLPPRAALPLNSLLLMVVALVVVAGPPAKMPPPLVPAELLKNRLFCTDRVPRLFSSAKPPPKPVVKLWAMVLLLMVTVLLPACPMPPPNWPAVLPLITEFVSIIWDVPTLLPMASSQMPAPWLRQLLLAMVELLMR